MATMLSAPAILAAAITWRPTPPHPITATRSPGLDPAGIADRSEAGEHGATDQRRLIERKGIGHLHHR